MSEEIKENFDGIDVEILEGDRGEFTIIVGAAPAHLIFDKNKTDRFPLSGEITKIIKGK